jgi:AraC-like DNA-binding protein
MKRMNSDFEQICSQLAARISRWTGDGNLYDTPVPGLTLHRHTESSAVLDCLLEPALSIPVQGRKRVRLGSDAFEYDRHRFLLTSLDLPVAMQFAEASPSAPFLCAVLRLDTRTIGELVMETGAQAPPRTGADTGPGAVLGETTVGLLSALERLIALLDEPNLLPTLAPLIQREIFYRVLRSDVGGHLWQMASIENQGRNIGRAIDRLKAEFREPLSIGALAEQVGMSSSRFHHHFKRLTSMSPLQFQKWLRLTEARRLMLVKGADASAAAYDVGYESPSQFSREYSRQFGEAPSRDVREASRVAMATSD